ncbi:MAG: ribonuclease P protein component [Candidatus Lambdaproteobacteria bacterium]|nr:ribonuclease P protein component [Candidatus Lambdaproteobacteria bacterium]
MSSRFGYPRGLRLRSRKDIAAVFRKGRYHRLGMLHAKTLPATGATPRFLISVKKKVGTAPERNRIKRVVREAIRLHRAALTAPYDICLFLTGRPRELPRLETVEPEIEKLFQRLAAAGPQTPEGS